MNVIIDYGVGNPNSILNMVRHVGGSAVISSKKEDILKASALILPGVGSFDNGIKKLRSMNLIAPLEKKVLVDKIPFLGICVGMQLLFDSSEEGVESGLGWLPGKVRKFKFEKSKLKIPHMGWNQIEVKKQSPLLKNLNNESRFYFVHSYYVECSDKAHSLTETEYGSVFSSMVSKGNINASQFHPEKSHKFGMQLIKNFLELE